ncbi:MAG TPA: HEAT repeat domain-containing protein [Candidatus Altiarchaeales archaeon]|nr:HEAT repeat domain-containing protein [Candidatus Altiarchaeales archaeon]
MRHQKILVIITFIFLIVGLRESLWGEPERAGKTKPSVNLTLEQAIDSIDAKLSSNERLKPYIVVLLNSGTQDQILAVLEKILLQAKLPFNRSYAAFHLFILWRNTHDNRIPMILKKALNDSLMDIRIDILWKLHQMGEEIPLDLVEKLARGAERESWAVSVPSLSPMAKPKSKEELIEEAKDSVQIQALKLLYEIKGKDIAPMLWEMLQKMPYSKTRDNVQIQALKLLYKIKGKDIAPMLWEMLQKMPYSKAWGYAAEIFSEIAPREINGKEIAPILWKMLEEMPYGKKWGVLARIYRKIAPPPDEVKIVDYGPGPWTPEQIKEYERQLVEANRKRYALELLGHLKWLEQNYKNEHIIESVFRDLTDARDLRAIPLLIKVLKYNPNWRNRVYAARTIGLIETYNNDSSAIPDLIKALNDSNVPVRIAVSEVLIKLGKADITVPVLFSIFKETSDDRALNLLKEIGNKKVIEGLKECLNSPDKAIREKAEKALREIEEKRQKDKGTGGKWDEDG